MFHAKARLAAAVVLAALFAVPLALGPRPVAARAQTEGNGTVIVQMFDWPWTSIASECTNVLGPDGYGAVQISPPQEAVVLAADGYRS
jgi:alpha-amylase